MENAANVISLDQFRRGKEEETATKRYAGATHDPYSRECESNNLEMLLAENAQLREGRDEFEKKNLELAQRNLEMSEAMWKMYYEWQAKGLEVRQLDEKVFRLEGLLRNAGIEFE